MITEIIYFNNTINFGLNDLRRFYALKLHFERLSTHLAFFDFTRMSNWVEIATFSRYNLKAFHQVRNSNIKNDERTKRTKVLCS